MTIDPNGSRSVDQGNVGQRGEPSFVRRLLLTFTVAALFLLLIAFLWLAGQVLLLVFASILIAILLHDASGFIVRHSRLSYGISLGIVMLVILALLGFVGWLLLPKIVDQINQLAADLPQSLERLRDYLGQFPVFQQLMQKLPAPAEMFNNMSAIVKQAGSVFSGLLGVIVNMVVIAFISIYLAFQPQVYTNGLIKLLPKERRERGTEVLQELHSTLSLWLLGKLAAMVVVGTATAIGLSLLGVPLALTLGIIAGLFDFIPYLGPILAGVPAVLIAFSQGPTLALYVILLMTAVQVLESYLLQPLVERKTVSMPPALTITVQLLMGLAFGLFGVALATPLFAAIAVAIAMLYVQDVLGDKVQLPGEDK